MSVRGPASPTVRPPSTPSTQNTQGTQSTQRAPSTDNTQAPPVPGTSQPATTTSTQAPQSSQATTQSRADAQSARSNDVAASQLQQRATAGGLGHASSTSATTEGHGVNRGAAALPSASGPLPPGAWNNPGRDVLGHLTQHSAAGAQDGHSDDNRCGPANVLGSAIMRGQGPTAQLLEHTAGDTNARLSDTDRASLRTIASDVRGGTATYEQLSQAQDLLYRGSNTTQSFDEVRGQALASQGNLTAAERTQFQALDQRYMNNTMNQQNLQDYSRLITRATGVSTTPRVENGQLSVDVTGSRATSALAGGYTDGELQDAGTRGGTPVSQSPLDGTQFERDGTSRSLRAQLEGLRPGQSATVRVAGSAEAARSGIGDHFITVGRQPDGTPYIYNPDPSRGQATVYVGNGTDPAHQPQDFDREIRRYEDRVSLIDDNGEPVRATIMGP